MSKWTFEPGHTAAGFSVRHMMVTNIRGHFKNVQGKLDFDPDNPGDFSVEVTIDAAGICTGEEMRDGHLASADFLDVENYPEITFKAEQVDMVGAHDFTFTGDLTIRGVTRQAILNVTWLGSWETPWWEGDEDKGPKTRAGFVAKTTINRHDFGVSWQGALEKGGIVVGNMVEITIDAEAIWESP
jgi:polyisoprenoid-binding protein YceI